MLSNVTSNATADAPFQLESIMTYKLWTLAYVIIINFIYVFIAMVLWYHLWVKNLGGIRICSNSSL